MNLKRALAAATTTALIASGIAAPSAGAESITVSNDMTCTVVTVDGTTTKNCQPNTTGGQVTEGTTTVTNNGSAVPGSSGGSSESTWAIAVAGLILLGTVVGVSWPQIQKFLTR